MASKQQLFTLHKYYLNASLMKHQLDMTLKSDSGKGANNPDVWSYLSLWYGCLRVVLEGWDELGLKDPIVDHLIDPDRVKLLHGFRNDTFHFKPDYISKRSLALLEDDDFVSWIRELHGPLGSSILRQMKNA